MFLHYVFEFIIIYVSVTHVFRLRSFPLDMQYYKHESYYIITSTENKICFWIMCYVCYWINLKLYFCEKKIYFIYFVSDFLL